MDRFLLMNCFMRVVETGSFSAVARELRTSQPSVSRYIAVLEHQLGTRLLHRSTRKLTLTPEGERYYNEVRRILDAVSEAESNARGEDKPTGMLRVTCSTSMCRIHLLPRVRTFLERYPNVEVDVHVADRYLDLTEEGLDLAIRIGHLKDSSLKARPIGVSHMVCVASSDYLARHGAPRHPNDLLEHNCIIYTLTPAGSNWRFRDGEMAVKGRLRVSSADSIHGAVVGGLGIGCGALWLFEDALSGGQVQLVLREYIGAPAPINIVYSAGRLLQRRATVFMDFIAEEFSRIPAMQKDALAHLTGAKSSAPRKTPGVTVSRRVRAR